MKRFFAGLLVLSGVLFTGCATTTVPAGWSPAQKAKLAQVTVTPVTAAPTAYHRPDVTESPGFSQHLPKLMGAGVAPALLGVAWDGVVTTRQQKKFDAKEGAHLDALHAQSGPVPVDALTATLQDGLKAHAFFGPRLATDAPARFIVRIVGYGLYKSSDTKAGDTLLRVRIIAEVQLVAGDEQLLKGVMIGIGQKTARAAEIARDPDFFHTGSTEAAADLVERLVFAMDVNLNPLAGG